MQKRLLKIVSILLVLAMAFAVLAGCGDPEETGSDAPVITMGTEYEIPDTAYVGQTINLPTATSTNAADGSAITVGVRVTTTRSNGNSGTAMTEQAATTTRSFTVPADVTECHVIYRAQDPGTGLSDTEEFKIAVQADTEAPVITLSSSDAITTTSAQGVLLPTATVTDAPTDADITATALRVTVSETDGTASNNVTSYATQGVRFYLPAGNYTVTYTASDTAGNAAESKSISVAVSDTAERYAGNLLSTGSIVIGNDVTFNSRGELVVGKTSTTAQDGDNSTATLAGYKFQEGEYVSTVFTIDPMTDAPEEYFYINYVSSRNYNSLIPDGNESAGAPRVVLRFSTIATQVFLDGSGNQAGGNAYNSATYRDGNVHVMYMQVLRYVGEERATDEAYDTEGARIVFNVWFDTLPTEEPTMAAEIICGESTSNSGTGELVASQFEVIWNNPYGYLNFGAFSGNYTEAGVWNDDAMHIRGIYAYEEGETEFADTTPPVITVSEVPETIAVINEAFTLPSATAADGATAPSVLVHIYDAERKQVAEITDLSTAKSYTFTEAGTYYVSYEAADEAQNINWVEYTVRVLEFADSDDPVIDLSTDALTGTVGQAVTLPDVSVSDATDPNGITLGLAISGPESYANYFANGQLTTFVPQAAGTYTLTYYAEDSTGNRAEEAVTLTVAHAAEGNVLTEAVNIRNNSNWRYTGEEVFRQKVSMWLNAYISADGWNIMMQLAGGASTNYDWPDGIILGITDGYIQLRVGGWNGWRYGFFESWTGWDAYKADNTFVKFEYQLTDVTYQDADYILVQLWVNDVELRATTDDSAMGVLGTTAGYSGGIMIPKTGANGITGTYDHSLYSGNLQVSTNSGFGGTENNMTIAALRVDGTSVTEEDLPDGCTAATAAYPTLPAGGSGVVDDTDEATPVAQVTSADEGYTMLTGTTRSLSDNTLQSVTLKLQFSETWADGTNVNAQIRLLGTGDDGIDLVIGDSSYGKGYATIKAGGTTIGWIKEQAGTTGGSGDNTNYLDAFLGTDPFYLNIAVSYVLDDNDNVKAINIALKFSTDGSNWENVYIYRTGSTGCNSDFAGIDGVMYDYSYSTGNQGYAAAINVYPWLVGGNAGLTDGGIGVQMLGSGTLTVLSVKAETATVA